MFKKLVAVGQSLMRDEEELQLDSLGNGVKNKKINVKKSACEPKMEKLGSLTLQYLENVFNLH